VGEGLVGHRPLAVPAANRGDLRGIGVKHIDAVRSLINSRKSGKIVEIPGGSTVQKQSGMLVFVKNNIEKPEPDN